jgi:hypothetical protein
MHCFLLATDHFEKGKNMLGRLRKYLPENTRASDYVADISGNIGWQSFCMVSLRTPIL